MAVSISGARIAPRLAGLVGILLLVGCGSADPQGKDNVAGNSTVSVQSEPPNTAAKPSAVEGRSANPFPRSVASQADVDALIAKRGSVTFLSHDGKWIGDDSDRQIGLYPENVVHLVIFGVGVLYFRGVYRVDAFGRVQFTFEKSESQVIKPPDWKPMKLEQDARSLLLTFEDAALNVRDRPFRPLSDADERLSQDEVLNRWSKLPR